MAAIYINDHHYRGTVLSRAPYKDRELILFTYQRNTLLSKDTGEQDERSRIVLIDAISMTDREEIPKREDPPIKGVFRGGEIVLQTIKEIKQFLIYTVTAIEEQHPRPWEEDYRGLVEMQNELTQFESYHPDHDEYSKDIFHPTSEKPITISVLE